MESVMGLEAASMHDGDEMQFIVTSVAPWMACNSLDEKCQAQENLHLESGDWN